ncbi:MAG: DUF4340 domain-containing protein [Leptolyngbyaceae cyanobacterium bins.349]|nr:DUF4340 domain-containing protein [Leptolyngbyaceae cyanobacterium bins.349]
MKIQRTPIILLAIAALLGAGVLLYESQPRAKQEETQATTTKLFPFQEADVQAFTVTTPLHTRSFAKVPAVPPTPKPASPPPASPVPQVWKMTAPKPTTASEGSVAFLLNLIGTGTSDRTITVPTARLGEFGLQQPQATVEITLKDQKKHRLVLGNPDFNRSFLYAQVDPPTAPTPEQTIHLVSLDFENAVNRPLEEWQEQAADKPQKIPPLSPQRDD